MHKVQFVKIQADSHGLLLLKQFLNTIPEGEKYFGYFKKRSLSVIENHIVCFLLCKDSLPLAYGHLDPDAENVWLGVAVADAATGQGYGRMMVTALIEYAKTLNITRIILSVSKTNSAAISLYESIGFTCFNEEPTIRYYNIVP